MKKMFSKFNQMFPLKYWLYLGLFTVMSNPAIARDLESIATNLTSKTSKVAFSILPIGFLISAIFMVFGSPKGVQIASGTVLASFFAIGAVSIVNWFKGIVG